MIEFNFITKTRLPSEKVFVWANIDFLISHATLTLISPIPIYVSNSSAVMYLYRLNTSRLFISMHHIHDWTYQFMHNGAHRFPNKSIAKRWTCKISFLDKFREIFWSFFAKWYLIGKLWLIFFGWYLFLANHSHIQWTYSVRNVLNMLWSF